jgi:hypothetical protein
MAAEIKGLAQAIPQHNVYITITDADGNEFTVKSAIPEDKVDLTRVIGVSFSTDFHAIGIGFKGELDGYR